MTTDNNQQKTANQPYLYPAINITETAALSCVHMHMCLGVRERCTKGKLIMPRLY